jgi:hypothetical protein
VNQPWLAIIDHSIDIGTKKGKAIQLKDCERIGLKILEIVSGESISLELAQIFSQAGNPDAIIKRLMKQCLKTR